MFLFVQNAVTFFVPWVANIENVNARTTRSKNRFVVKEMILFTVSVQLELKKASPFLERLSVFNLPTFTIPE
jgi:hypothetical protein